MVCKECRKQFEALIESRIKKWDSFAGRWGRTGKIILKQEELKALKRELKNLKQKV